MCLITSRLPCFTISKATIKSCACRLCIVVCLSRMRLLNWGRFKCFALYELIFEFSFLSWPGVSLVLSSPSYTLNPLPFSSFKSEKGYRPMKVRRVCCILVFVVVCWNPFVLLYLSKTFGSLFHYEQPYISISRSIYYHIQSSCKGFFFLVVSNIILLTFLILLAHFRLGSPSFFGYLAETSTRLYA